MVAADLDEDGDVDLYVSNDTTPNFLWENQGDGTFVDRGVVSGTAFNRYGACEAGMSVEAADFDGDGRFDLFVTNFFHETNTFYRNEGKLLFSDVTPATGLGAPSKLRLGFGTCGLDFDRDTFLDLLVVNGHVHDRLHEIDRDEPFAQLPLLFHNEKGKRFSEVSAGSGRYFAEPHVGRGAAAADFDRDGDADVAVNHLNGPAALLRNETTPAGGWLQIELVGTSSNRGGVGAVLTIDLGRQRAGPYAAGRRRLLFVRRGTAVDRRGRRSTRPTRVDPLAQRPPGIVGGPPGQRVSATCGRNGAKHALGAKQSNVGRPFQAVTAASVRERRRELTRMTADLNPSARPRPAASNGCARRWPS